MRLPGAGRDDLRPDAPPDAYFGIANPFETPGLIEGEQTTATHHPRGIPFEQVEAALSREQDSKAAKDVAFMDDVFAEIERMVGGEEAMLQFLLLFQPGRGEIDENGEEYSVDLPGVGEIETENAVFSIRMLDIRYQINSFRQQSEEAWVNDFINSAGSGPLLETGNYVRSNATAGRAIFSDDFQIWVDRNFGLEVVDPRESINNLFSDPEDTTVGVQYAFDDIVPGDISPTDVAQAILHHVRQGLRSNNRFDPWVEFGIATAEVIFSVAAIATGAGALAVAGRAASIAIKGGIFLEANNLAGTGLRYIGVPLHNGAAGEVYNPLVAATRHLGNATGLHQGAANLEMAIHSLNLCMAFGYSTKVKALSAVGTSGTAALVMNHYDMTQRLVDAYEQDANFTDQID